MDEILKILKEKVEKIAQGRHGVYFHVPEKAPYPYVSLEVQESFTENNLRKTQGEVKCTFWSRYPGVQQVMTETDRLEKGLEGFGDTQKFIFRVRKKSSKLLADGLTRQGILTLRFVWKG